MEDQLLLLFMAKQQHTFVNERLKKTKNDILTDAEVGLSTK